jgi:uncharacterized membrane protein YccC
MERMNNKKVTTVLFLSFAIVVAFFNTLVGNYQYWIFCIPFIIALIVKHRSFKAIEIGGLVFVALYVFIIDNIYAGIIALFVASILLYCENFSVRIVHTFIMFATIIVVYASIHSTVHTANIIIHVFIDSGAYFILSHALHCTISNAINKEPLEQRYIDVLQNVIELAEDAIEESKREDKHGE